MGTKFKGDAAEVRALDAFVKLARAANTVLNYANSDLEALGLSPSQFAVLEALYHVGPLNLGDLARRILKSSGNLTLVVDNLQKRGLVERQKQGEDKALHPRNHHPRRTEADRRQVPRPRPPHRRNHVPADPRRTDPTRGPLPKTRQGRVRAKHWPLIYADKRRFKSKRKYFFFFFICVYPINQRRTVFLRA